MLIFFQDLIISLLGGLVPITLSTIFMAGYEPPSIRGITQKLKEIDASNRRLEETIQVRTKFRFKKLPLIIDRITAKSYPRLKKVFNVARVHGTRRFTNLSNEQSQEIQLRLRRDQDGEKSQSSKRHRRKWV